jgi:hypothetical protein
MTLRPSVLIGDADADQTNAFGNVSCDGDDEIAAGRWVHLAATYDAATRVLQVYADGISVCELTTTGGDGTILDNGNPVRMGRREAAPDTDLDGAVDDVRIYDVALTPEQIAAVMAGD